MIELRRLNDESDEEVIFRICQAKDEIGTWGDVANILNEILGFEYTESKYRKQYTSFEKILEANKKHIFDDEYANVIDEKKRELYKERQRLNDERSSLNRMLREDARASANYEALTNAIKDNAKVTLPPIDCSKLKLEDDEDMIIILSDLHIGLQTSNNFGSYDTEIAKDRLAEYRDEICKLQVNKKCKNAYVVLIGDMVSGSIHVTTRLENRENTIQQTQHAAELISNFTYGISAFFENVYVNSVAGNHSRIGLKDEVLRDERLDDIIPWYMKAKLDHLSNIHFLDESNIDSTIGNFEVKGNKVVIVHGDYDTFSEAGVSKLTMMLRYIPDIVIMGHLHHSEYTSISDVDIVRCGSLCGACNDYEISKRIMGKPQQMVLTVGENGINSFYPMKFSK